jgi:hypothetical protein
VAACLGLDGAGGFRSPAVLEVLEPPGRALWVRHRACGVPCVPRDIEPLDEVSYPGAMS